ncbi:MAG: ABC transporter ATP-binding protein [Candidatus Sumerlaeia bacterium]
MIELDGISKTYGQGTNAVYALRDASLRIGEGEALAILGPSGSGKTTLLDILGTLSHPTAGKYLLNDRDVFSLSHRRIARIRNHHFGFVFQSFNLLPAMTVYRNVALPLRYSRIRRGQYKSRVKESLERVGLGHKIKALANQLSGGEMQRVAIARAIVADPSAVLADEPTGNLDSKNGEAILNLLFELREHGKTIIMVTHNEELAAKFPRIIRIFDGRIVYDGAPDSEVAS